MHLIYASRDISCLDEGDMNWEHPQSWLNLAEFNKSVHASQSKTNN